MTTATTLTRPQRAMQLCMRTQKQWTPARIGINIPSRSRSGLTHNTTVDACDCEDHRFRMVACVHMLAARIFLARNS